MTLGNWRGIELFESHWNSSGKYAQDALQSSKRIKICWLNWSVNLSNSKARSSSDQRTTTLCGKNEERRKMCCEFWFGCELCLQIIEGTLFFFCISIRVAELALINQTEIRLIPKNEETCHVNTSTNSQNFMDQKNWSNSVTILVWWTLRKDNSSKWESMSSTRHFESKKHPVWESGFSVKRKSTLF